jgi:hypothetical protein
MRGRVDSLAWKLPDDLSEDEWIEAGIILAKIGAGVTWWVGDYWIYGNKKYGDRKAIVEGPNWRGPSFQTCQCRFGLSSVRNFPSAGSSKLRASC